MQTLVHQTLRTIAERKHFIVDHIVGRVQDASRLTDEVRVSVRCECRRIRVDNGHIVAIDEQDDVVRDFREKAIAL